jgi:hypothetical protein
MFAAIVSNVHQIKGTLWPRIFASLLQACFVHPPPDLHLEMLPDDHWCPEILEQLVAALPIPSGAKYLALAGE